jgi:mono/diheme cytochrome c family protein
MIYPFWDVQTGYGILMAIIAIVHVFIAHFAIGGGLYLVVTEQLARRRNDAPLLAFLQKLAKFFVLVTLVAGVLTGVGIWFIIGLLNPLATEALIHNYVWGWATEWTFFVGEIAAALIYYYGWNKMAAKAHITVGWIYFIFAWLSLVVINGIITFMLTPGKWLATGDFWDGFFNPTYWPSLIMRTGVCVMLAGLYALLVASRQPDGDFKVRIVRYSATWGLLGLAVTALAQGWYLKTILLTLTTKILPGPVLALRSAAWLAIAIGGLLMLAWLLARRLPVVIAVLLMAVGLAWFGAFESFRESVRKPYVITGYIYGNGVEVAKTEKYKKEGYLAQIPYRTGNDGADLFRHACRSCHTMDGYRPLKPAFAGTDPKFIADIVRGAHLLNANMPPFLGTPAEADQIAAYIYRQVDQRPLDQIYPAADLGRQAFATRCAKCHKLGTSTDKSKSFTGQSAEDLNSLLDSLPELADGMPAYTGNATERAALVAYLQSLGKAAK